MLITAIGPLGVFVRHRYSLDSWHNAALAFRSRYEVTAQ